METATRVTKLAPFVHVRDVERSIAFYARLGFEVTNALPRGGGTRFWAYLRSGNAELMLALASGAIDPGVQAVVFYLYGPKVADVRNALLAAGVPDGGPYRGLPMATGDVDGRPRDHSTVFEVAHPHHLPAGELRLHDPDGYVVMMGQLA